MSKIPNFDPVSVPCNNDLLSKRLGPKEAKLLLQQLEQSSQYSCKGQALEEFRYKPKNIAAPVDKTKAHGAIKSDSASKVVNLTKMNQPENQLDEITEKAESNLEDRVERKERQSITDDE